MPPDCAAPERESVLLQYARLGDTRPASRAGPVQIGALAHPSGRSHLQQVKHNQQHLQQQHQQQQQPNHHHHLRSRAGEDCGVLEALRALARFAPARGTRARGAGASGSPGGSDGSSVSDGCCDDEGDDSAVRLLKAYASLDSSSPRCAQPRPQAAGGIDALVLLARLPPAKAPAGPGAEPQRSVAPRELRGATAARDDAAFVMRHLAQLAPRHTRW